MGRDAFSDALACTCLAVYMAVIPFDDPLCQLNLKEDQDTICRTANTLLSSSSGDKPSKFHRSRKYKGTGYFSAVSKPYRPFGDILDMDSLGIITQSNFLPSGLANNVRHVNLYS